MKLAIVIDGDVDISSDQDVMWAVCTRMQADTDINILKNCMGAILDPSNCGGLTSKMKVVATKPTSDFPARHTIPDYTAGRARELTGRYKENIS